MMQRSSPDFSVLQSGWRWERDRENLESEFYDRFCHKQVIL